VCVSVCVCVSICLYLSHTTLCLPLSMAYVATEPGGEHRERREKSRKIPSVSVSESRDSRAVSGGRASGLEDRLGPELVVVLVVLAVVLGCGSRTLQQEEEEVEEEKEEGEGEEPAWLAGEGSGRTQGEWARRAWRPGQGGRRSPREPRPLELPTEDDNEPESRCARLKGSNYTTGCECSPL